MNEQRVCQSIAQIMHKALLYEVTAAPKPGLVDPLGNGSHQDMNYFTFLDSAVALLPYFYGFAQAGTQWSCVDSQSLLTIRPLGKSCEQAMFQATEGVNTHKGAIFILSILSASAAYLYTQMGGIVAEALCEVAAQVAEPALEDLYSNKPTTKGEQLFQKYGILGVRGEVAHGLPSVMQYALPILRKGMPIKNPNEVMLDALLALIAHVEDTNILARKGQEVLLEAQHQAALCIQQGGTATPQGRERLERLNRWFEEENISPGGCADLLSATLAIYWLEQLE